MLRFIDKFLNRITMYRQMLYLLSSLIVIAFLFALGGQLSVSASGILLSTVVLVIVCYVVNRGLAKLLRIPTNTESWLITALILVLILPPPTTVPRLALIGLTGAIAVASKFIIHWRGAPVFNPAAFGALVVSIAGLLPATWWIGSPPMAAFVAVGGLLVVRKLRRFDLFAGFIVVALLFMLLVAAVNGGDTAWNVVKSSFLSWPLLFLGTVMLTEPSTTPSGRNYRLYYGALVGAIFACQLHVGRIGSTPQVALIIGNLLTLIVAERFGGRLVLKAVTKLGLNSYDLAFAVPAGQRLHFRPGQYLEWTLPHSKTDIRGNRRTFSIASSPLQPEVHIGIKLYEPSSSYKKALMKLQPGQTMRAAQPAGDFVLPADRQKPLVFIAGGIGITPFHAMIQYLLDADEHRSVTLLYIASAEAEFSYQDTFKAASRVGVDTHYLTERLTTEQLAKIAPKGSLFYISGPDAMVTAYKRLLRRNGVAARRIKTDHFSGY